MMEWGEKIVVDGKRPDWLRDGDMFYAFTGQTEMKVPSGHTIRWTDVLSIVLPVDHPYYVATNAGFIYWPGGTMAPHDWDGWIVLLRNGRRMQPHPGMLNWSHDQYGNGIMDSDIVGYQKKVETIGINYLERARDAVEKRFTENPFENPDRAALNVIADQIQVINRLKDELLNRPVIMKVPHIPIGASGHSSMDTSDSDTIDGVPYSDVLRILDAVKAGDLAAAQACLPVDPFVERARELYKRRSPIPIDETSLSFQVTCDALREGMGDALREGMGDA